MHRENRSHKHCYIVIFIPFLKYSRLAKTSKVSTENRVYKIVRSAPQYRPFEYRLSQCFSTAGPRPGTGPLHQLYRAARGSPGICHFCFLSNFSWIKYFIVEIFWGEKYSWMCRKAQTQMLAWGNYNMLQYIMIFINCNWVVTRWQWLFCMYTKHEIGYYWI